MASQQTNSKDTSSTTKYERYVEYALDRLRLGIGPGGVSMAFENTSANRTVFVVDGPSMRNFLRAAAASRGETIRRDTLAEIIEELDAKAHGNGILPEMYLRVGYSSDKYVEIDVADEANTRILLKGGRVHTVTSMSETLFRRPISMAALPNPAPRGDWKLLLPFLNMPSDQQLLVVAWITFVLTHPKGAVPYPMLIVHGEQGSGKSFFSKVMRQLVDPNEASVSMLPKDVRDLAIAAQHSHMLVYDNVRNISKELSDHLCMVATGGTISTRRLYTDADQSLLKIHAPLLLNGIHPFVREPDLADRALSVKLQTLNPNSRQEEGRLRQEFESQLPKIFRGLLVISAKALTREAKTKVTHPTRMLSFSRWLAALELVLEKPSGELQKLYAENLKDSARDEALDDPLTSTVITLASTLESEQWTGTPTELLNHLGKLISDRSDFSKADLPSNAISLSKQLRSRTARLRTLGVAVTFLRSEQRQIRIGQLSKESN